MLTRQEYEQQELERLAPYACRSAESRGRMIEEPNDPYRTIFQRDRDRIIHSSAFRRLEYKTQVFVNHEGDYYRTRLTHSLEVAQLSRAIARSLRLNEEAAEAIALAHDLGHTPFGHAGEDAMNELMKAYNGFEHNHQSYRVVTKLERRYPQYAGLNLSYEVLEGIIKHSGEYDVPRGVEDFTEQGYPSLEAQIVNLADEIAYTTHDLDDGLKSEMISFSGLDTVPLWQDCVLVAKKHCDGHSEKIIKHQAVRELMRRCVHNLLDETAERIVARNIAHRDDVRERGEDIVAFSEHFTQEFQALKDYLFHNLYRHFRVVRMAEKAKGVLVELFDGFQKNPNMLPTEHFARISAECSAERAICDYIAGMTDRYAFEEHRRLFDPMAKV